MNNPTRARTHHEELLAQRSCFGVIAPVALALGVFLHPGLASLPNRAAAADTSAALLSDTKYAVGRDIADTPLPAPLLDFSASRFAMPDASTLACVSPIPQALTAYLAAQHAPDGTAALILTGIDTAQRLGYTTPDPLLLACIARYESRFSDAAIGKAGERGLLQIHPCHKRSMMRLGLDYNDGADRVAYACVLWASAGLKPWSVRKAAQRDYIGSAQ